MPDGRPLRVVLVASDPLVRAGLASMLQGEAGIEVAYAGAEEQPSFPDDALRSADVILLDLDDGDRAAVATWSPLPVLVLVPEGGEALALLASGAAGAIDRNTAPDRLAAAVAAVAAGLTVLEPHFFAPLLEGRAAGGPSEPLTTRELEVLRLLAEGLSNKALARRLDISEHTVKFHVNSLLGKLGAGGRTEAVTRAIRWGLIPL